jgi:hypothetical protein
VKKIRIVFLAFVLALISFQTFMVKPVGATPQFMLIGYGTSRSIDPVTKDPIGLTDEFSRNDAKIYAWFMIGYTLPTNATYTWKWYDPAGNLYWQSSLNHSGNGPNKIAGEPLNIGEIPMAQRVGLWRVEVYIDGVLLFQQNFTIGRYLVVVSVRGLPKALKTVATIDGNRTEEIQGSTAYTLQFDEGTFHTIAFEGSINDGEGIRYVNATSTGPLNVSARKLINVAYSTQYYLKVNSQYGDPQGSGWYEKGANANFSVSSPVYDYLATKHALTGWTGDYTGTESTGTIEMDGPRTIEALWENDYTFTYVLVIIIIAIIAALVIARMRMKRKSQSRPT